MRLPAAEYVAGWQLDDERAALLPDHALVLHAGPQNRGLELSGPVADRASAQVTAQVACGVAVRTAVLEHVLGSGNGSGR